MEFSTLILNAIYYSDTKFRLLVGKLKRDEIYYFDTNHRL
jgi:hypothetical protein